MKKLWILLILWLITIGACSGTAQASAYNTINSTIQENNLDTPVHAVMGIGSVFLGNVLLPDDWSRAKKLKVSIAGVLTFALIDECFNKNFNLYDPLEVAGFAAIGGITLISIDF
jgi:hypothetical protein